MSSTEHTDATTCEEGNDGCNTAQKFAGINF